MPFDAETPTAIGQGRTVAVGDVHAAGSNAWRRFVHEHASPRRIADTPLFVSAGGQDQVDKLTSATAIDMIRTVALALNGQASMASG